MAICAKPKVAEIEQGLVRSSKGPESGFHGLDHGLCHIKAGATSRPPGSLIKPAVQNCHTSGKSLGKGPLQHCLIQVGRIPGRALLTTRNTLIPWDKDRWYPANPASYHML